MYCHAMATLALCEAYALTGDARLRGPVERAVAFMSPRAQPTEWPGVTLPAQPAGDTSILGWVVMVLKSAKEIGIPIPEEARSVGVRCSGSIKSPPVMPRALRAYQPSEQVTPTMTAEAWVCRQFLGVGGPGDASSEAAAFVAEA